MEDNAVIDGVRVEEECDDNERRQQTRDLSTTLRSMTDSSKCNLMVSGRRRGAGLGFVSLSLSCGGELLV